MAKFIHFAPLNKVGQIRYNGLRVSRARHRSYGVYAVPCVGFSRLATSIWRFTLKDRHKKNQYAAVIFEIADDELVKAYRDWDENLGLAMVLAFAIPDEDAPEVDFYNELRAIMRESHARHTMRAFQSEALAHKLARENARAEPANDRYTKAPSYHFGTMEVVIPRSITASEIVTIIPPARPKEKTAKVARLRQKAQDRKYFAEVLLEMDDE